MPSIHLRPFVTSALLALTATGVLALSGCGPHLKDRGPVSTNGPTASPTGTPAAPDTALAERYHRSGGVQDVYGIQYRSESGAPFIIVWTRNPDESSAPFETIRNGVPKFLAAEEHVSLAKGYQLYIIGPTGALLHRWDMRP